MTAVDRTIWLCGLVALVVTVVYWPTIKSAYKNRQLIGQAAGIASALGV
jgi:hypothetical protein